MWTCFQFSWVHTQDCNRCVTGLSMWLVWLKTARRFSPVVHHFLFAPTMHESSNCSTSLLPYGTVSLFNFNYYSRYTVVFHCPLNLHFLFNSWCWSLFHVLLVILISSFETCSNLSLIFITLSSHFSVAEAFIFHGY